MRDLLRDQGGVTAIEFAIVVGPFLLLLGGIIEVGIMLFAEYTLQNAVQEAARKIQVGQMTAATADDFKKLVCDKAPNLLNCQDEIGIYVDNAATFAELAANPPQLSSIPPRNATPFNTGEASRAVVAVATYDWTFTFPFMAVMNNVPGTRRLMGIAVHMNEAFTQ